ncbi:MAG: histidine--tRNA ligase, partial [bacterium]|nr:histidine--tRNA ligase [bacterium]
EEYSASVLEPAELYKAKSGEEIVNKQTYTFIDRGERDVTLRPEMTPTVARMVAAKRRELVFPVRWYSIPNLFRYEQPQRGRLREHWQLNVDIFGVDSLQAEIEVIQIASDITKSYGLKETDFEVRLNNRKVMNYVTRDVFGLSEEQSHKVSKLIDKKDKVPADIFTGGIREVVGENTAKLLTLLNSKNFEEFTTHLPQTKEEHDGLREIKEVIAGLEKLGITNVRFDQTLMRGFDYYTGIVFEVFDINPANRRSVFGGGRYDDLLSLFGGEKVPAVGFGAGDVVAQDLMETYGNSTNTSSQADIGICIIGEQNTDYALDVAQSLREKGHRVFVDLSFKKVGEQINNADKRKIPKVICIGDEEKSTGKYKVKDLATGNEEDHI